MIRVAMSQSFQRTSFFPLASHSQMFALHSVVNTLQAGVWDIICFICIIRLQEMMMMITMAAPCHAIYLCDVFVFHFSNSKAVIQEQKQTLYRVTDRILQ